MTDEDQHELLRHFINYIAKEEDHVICFFRDDGSRDGKWLPCPDYITRHVVERYLEWKANHG